MEEKAYADLSSEKLEEIKELEKKLGIILIAYDSPHLNN